MGVVHRLARPVRAGLAAPAERAGDRRPAGPRRARRRGRRVPWEWLVEDYDRIRDAIARVVPGFDDYNARVRHPGGFPLDHPVRRPGLPDAATARPTSPPRRWPGAEAGPGPAPADDDPQPRPVQHHHLRPRRPLPGHPRRAAGSSSSTPTTWPTAASPPRQPVDLTSVDDGRPRPGSPGGSWRSPTTSPAAAPPPTSPRPTSSSRIDSTAEVSNTPASKSVADQRRPRRPVAEIALSSPDPETCRRVSFAIDARPAACSRASPATSPTSRSSWPTSRARITAAGPRPARPSAPARRGGRCRARWRSAGYLGDGLVNTFLGGDRTTGTLTSPEFAIERELDLVPDRRRRIPGQDLRRAARRRRGRPLGDRPEHRAGRLGAAPAALAGTWRELPGQDRPSSGSSTTPPAAGGTSTSTTSSSATSRRRCPTSARHCSTGPTRSVAEAAARVGGDPTRPIVHFRPPAQWMNDPNGTIYVDGYYHLFYQHNPYGDAWGHMHWGHARSRDLVSWEHLPIALWPSERSGEEHVFSGCAAVERRRSTDALLYERRPRPAERAVGGPADRRRPAAPGGSTRRTR